MKRVCIVIPAYNERESLGALVSRLKTLPSLASHVRWTFMFVNDGSTDGTREMLDKLTGDKMFQVLHFSRNFGHQAAISAGLDHARADYFGIIDADLQDPPELFIDMLKELGGGYNLVYATRIRRKNETLFKLFTAKAFYVLINKLTKFDIPKDTGDFRMFDAKVHAAYTSMSEYHRFVRGMIAWLGFESKPIYYERDARYAGVTKYSTPKMASFALDAIFSFSVFPLRLANYLGLLIAIMGVIGLVYIVTLFLFKHDYIPGISSILFSVLFLGGIQLMSLGLIGEYVGRIYEQSKQRPLYIIENSSNIEAS